MPKATKSSSITEAQLAPEEVEWNTAGLYWGTTPFSHSLQSISSRIIRLVTAPTFSDLKQELGIRVQPHFDHLLRSTANKTRMLGEYHRNRLIKTSLGFLLSALRKGYVTSEDLEGWRMLPDWASLAANIDTSLTATIDTVTIDCA
jgi:hypothetical protein